MENKNQEPNIEESWMKEYLEFYDNMDEDRTKPNNSTKKQEEYKKSDIHYKFYGYEIFLILLFIFLIYASAEYERNFRINLSRSTGMWILSGFSSNIHIPQVSGNRKGFIGRIFYILAIMEHIIDIKKYILFDVLFILTLTLMSCRGGLFGHGDYMTAWILLFTPIGYIIGHSIKGLYNKFKEKEKK